MLCIVQARMSSRRLPGKVLEDVRGRPVLGHVLDRLKESAELDDLVVATSDDASDDPIEAFCQEDGIETVRGPLHDVEQRFRHAVEAHGSEAFVRISGDSPLIDPALVDRAIGYYRLAECDLVTNILERTYPKGQSVEVVRTATFVRISDGFMREDQREHVTRAYYEHPAAYRIVSFTSGMDMGHVNLCVDSQVDLARVRLIAAEAAAKSAPVGWRELSAIAAAQAF